METQAYAHTYPVTRRASDLPPAAAPSGNVYFSGHDSDLGEHRPETPVRKSSGSAAGMLPEPARTAVCTRTIGIVAQRGVLVTEHGVPAAGGTGRVEPRRGTTCARETPPRDVDRVRPASGTTTDGTGRPLKSSSNGDGSRREPWSLRLAVRRHIGNLQARQDSAVEGWCVRHKSPRRKIE